MPGTLSKSKLTLWIDKETKRFGKEWAKRHHESLSQLVANYLMRLRITEKEVSSTPLVKKLSGVLKSRSDKGFYRKQLERKYLGT